MTQEGLRERKKSNKALKTTETEVVNDPENRDPMFGPVPSFPNQRFWTRLLLILGTLVVVYFTSRNEKVVIFAKQKDTLSHRKQEIKCDPGYFNELSSILGGNDKIRCGRIIMDSVVSRTEASQLFEIAMKGLSLTGEPAGGASILDLHSGAVSAGKSFINIYSLNVSDLFTEENFNLYTRVRKKVHEALAFGFNLPSDKLFLTKPTFFSRLTGKMAATVHDEYWHPHVDKETYESFHFTSLIYLNDFGVNFEGGRFVFDDKENVTTVVEPKTARVLMFSSGGENVHHVEKVISGQRLAITVSFTCDENKKIDDPSMERFSNTS